MATRESDDLPTLDVTSKGTRFVDNEGRTLTLRGVNLGGAKLPAGYESGTGPVERALRRARAAGLRAALLPAAGRRVEINQCARCICHRAGDATIGFPHRLAGAFERAPTFDAETGIYRLEFRADHTIKAPTEIFIPDVVQYPEGFVVELSDGDYKLERASDAVGGYCILRYTPGPPGYVSIVVVKRAGADDPPGRSCCAHSPDEALLPSKPSSETLLEM